MMEAKRTDRVTLEILKNYFVAIAEGMGYTLERTSHTTFIKESADFVTAVATPHGEFFAYPRTIGVSSFLGLDEHRGVLEIGGTYYRPKFRGTGFNRRVKDMMLRRAFDCGFRRIEFRVDQRNKRSQAAMAKLGAVREGVLRADRITWTGHVRDTVLFSILKDEWPS